MLTVICDDVVVTHFQRLGRLGFRVWLSHVPRSLSRAPDLVAVSTRKLTVLCDGRINSQRDKQIRCLRAELFKDNVVILAHERNDALRDGLT
jgi:hypothetical protein